MNRMIPAAALGLIALVPLADRARAEDAVYETYGTHNPPEVSPCASKDCVYRRGPTEPQDNPEFPAYWVSHWTMYRVFKYTPTTMPPYDGKPPKPLVDGKDYETSYGITYYDSTWQGKSGTGAMKEHYEKRCLPIFPIDNHYSCSFISLGDVAYFVTYADRPAWMPKVCLFSPLNHPPRRDFITHLPYSAGDSMQLKNKIQGYSFWISSHDGKPVQTGVSPDRTADQDIMFGYGFNATATPDRGDKTAAPYKHPQSFYFSGYPLPPANAPFVSQNYTDFAMVKPLPADTWDEVAGLDPNTLPACQLFDPPDTVQTGNKGALHATAPRAPTWGDLAVKPQ